jgi:hypothetical protein
MLSPMNVLPRITPALFFSPAYRPLTTSPKNYSALSAFRADAVNQPSPWARTQTVLLAAASLTAQRAFSAYGYTDPLAQGFMTAGEFNRFR